MQTKETRIQLLSWTQNPLETVYAEWVQSRTQDQVPSPSAVAADLTFEDSYVLDVYAPKPRKTVGELRAEVLEVFEKVVAMKMPLGETLDFIFLIEHCPIALREQLVRHRIGHKFGDKIGADIIPDLAGNSSFWSQTTRIVNMGSFATDGEYLTPHWLKENGDKLMRGRSKAPASGAGTMSEYEPDPPEPQEKTVAEFYHEQMKWIQAAYRRLVDAGMPLEDARNILPVAMQHRLTWKVNLSSLMHVLSRRGCWLAQLGFWEPVIYGIVEELATKVHPTFRRLIDPPCFDQTGRFTTCAFGRENEEIVNKGEYPPCSLWINNDAEMTVREKNNGTGELKIVGPERFPRYKRMMERYTKLWKRDPKTGQRIEVG